MAKLIAIDLGNHRVKLAVYEGGFGRYHLEQLKSARVDQDQDQAPDREGRLRALTALLDELPASGRPTFATAWPAEQASLRHVSLPFDDKVRVEKTLPFEVEGLVPFDMDDIELRHQILRLDPGDSHVLVAMVVRQALVDWLGALHQTGVDPRSVDVDAYALGTLAGEGVQAIVDIGHSRTVVSLCDDGQVVAARALNAGGRDLTLALCVARHIPWAEAEDRKHLTNIRPGRPSTPTAVEWEGEALTQPGIFPDHQPPDETPAITGNVDDSAVLRKAIGPLLAELHSTLIGFEDTLHKDISDVLLIGGTSHLAGLRTYLAATLGVPVRLAEPAQSAGDRADAGAWALVQAIGARAARGKASNMDLRQGKLAFKGDLYLARQVGIYGGVFAACALLAGTAMFVVRTIQLDRQLRDLDTEIAQAVVDTFPDEVSLDQVDSASKALAIMTEKSMEVTTRVDALGSIISPEPPTMSLLRDLSAAMPPSSDARIDVRELDVTTASIIITAETDGYEAATRIETSLQAMDRFKGAQKGDEKKSRGGGISFKVTIPRAGETDSNEEG